MTAASAGAYDAFVVMHVVCAVVGFGSVAISGVYGAIARRPQREGSAEEAARYFASGGRAEYLILLVPVFGFGALAFKDHGGSYLTQLWVLGGLLLWLVASVLLVAFVRPAERRINERAEARSGTVLMRAGIASDVLFLVALALMVTQPA